MKSLIKIILIGTLMLTAGLVSAGDAAAGKEKAALCAACHGPNGISLNDLWPNLAGQKEGTRASPDHSGTRGPLK